MRLIARMVALANKHGKQLDCDASNWIAKPLTVSNRYLNGTDLTHREGTPSPDKRI
jgi:hypothetical protein